MCWRASRATSENKRFLPGVTLPKILRVTGDLEDAAQADALLLACRPRCWRDFARTLAPLIAPGTPLVICAKGIEKDTGRLVNEVVAKAAPPATLAILSGPSFARDVAQGPSHRRDHRRARRHGARACRPA